MRELRTKNIITNFSNKPFDFVLLVVVFTMLSLGIVMVLSASSPTSLAETGNSYEYVKTQALSAILGIIAMFIMSKIDYRIFKKFEKIVYIVVIILLLSVTLIGASEGRSKALDKFGFY